MKKPVSQQTTCDYPKVSVAMITYNHENFIAQAIESVLMQETEFTVELVIGEDCSTDRTREIVRNYAAKYPHVIRAMFPEHNLGMQKNGKSVLAACRGEYLAILEGDDYWTDVSKLSRQVLLMDADPTLSFCIHRVVEFDESLGKAIGIFPVEDVGKFPDPVEELIQRNFIPSISRILRRSKIPVLDPEFEALKLGDWPLSILMAVEGKIGFLPETMATYRFHPGSTWSSKSQEVRDVATHEMFCYLSRHHRGPYHRSIERSMLRYCRFVLDHQRAQGLRANLSLMGASLKMAYRIHLPDLMVQVVWLFFYSVFPERKGKWYEALSAVARAVIAKS